MSMMLRTVGVLSLPYSTGSDKWGTSCCKLNYGERERERERRITDKMYWISRLNPLYFCGWILESHRGSRQSVQIMKTWTVQTVSVLALSTYRGNADRFKTTSVFPLTQVTLWKDLRVTSCGEKRKCMSIYWFKKSLHPLGNFRFFSPLFCLFFQKWMDGEKA